MNYLAIVVVGLFLGGHVYSYMQIQRLDQALDVSKAEVEALSLELEATVLRLDGGIKANTTDLEALNASNEESFSLVGQQIDGLEADIRADVSKNLTDEIVQAATAEAIEKAVLENLAQSEPLLLALSGVLAEQFRGELQGEPGEQVDPAVLASLLSKNEDFLDAIKFDLLVEIEPSE